MRNQIVDNIRGLCMLGVIGIHVGSLALTPNNFWLFSALEVLSRYSVPAFFFISGYGLFCSEKDPLHPSEDFSYVAFMKKRLKGAGLPYLSWSFFYLLYFWCVLPPGYISWNPLHLAYVLFFGLACYHLYFMVILLWFYACYPLWRKLLPAMHRVGLPLSMGLLLIFQLGFNWWTTHTTINPEGWNLLAKNFFNLRLNYVPFHYIFIFMLGGIAACHWQKLLGLLHRYAAAVYAFYVASIAYILGSAWYSFHYEGYDLLALANTYHQLSPQGLFYTIASLLTFCLVLDGLEQSYDAAQGEHVAQGTTNNVVAQNSPTSDDKAKVGKGWSALLYKGICVLSSYSMLMYFIHPLFLEWMTSFYTKFGIILTTKKVSASYFLLVALALVASVVLKKVFDKVPVLGLLFTGKAKKK